MDTTSLETIHQETLMNEYAYIFYTSGLPIKIMQMIVKEIIYIGMKMY